MIPKKFIELAIPGLSVKEATLKYFLTDYPDTNSCEILEKQIPLLTKDLKSVKYRTIIRFNEGVGGESYRVEYNKLATSKLAEKKASIANFSCVRDGEEVATVSTNNSTLPNVVPPVTVSGVTASNPIANQNSSAGPQSAVSTASQTATNANQTASVSEKAKSFPVFFQDKNKLALAGGGLLIAIVGGYYFIKKRKSQV